MRHVTSRSSPAPSDDSSPFRPQELSGKPLIRTRSTVDEGVAYPPDLATDKGLHEASAGPKRSGKAFGMRYQAKCEGG